MEMDDSTSGKDVTESILSTVLYFDIFDHPISLDEIRDYCPVKIELAILSNLVKDMCDSGILKSCEGYYGVGQIEKMVAERRKSEQRANEMMAQACKNGQFLEKFPFVNSACLSGSISKNVMHEESDVDYFIFARHKRVWICMLIMKLYKKIALRKQSEFFCLNYFISDQEMEIAEQSMFTAVEIASLLPVRETDLKEEIVRQNPWVRGFLPNNDFDKKGEAVQRRKKARVIQIIEQVFSGKIGTALDVVVRKLVGWVHRIKFRQLRNHPDWELMFRTSPNQAKFHSKNHHRKIIELHQDRLSSSKIGASILSQV